MHINQSDVVLVHHDLGASKPGAAKGPQIIWDALTRDPYPKLAVSHVKQAQDYTSTSSHPFAKHIDAISKSLETLSEIVKANLQRDNHCLVLAGDHGTAAGTVAGIKKAHPDKRIGVIWFDAHADIHSPHTTPSGNIHGMPVAVMTDQDNTLNRKNEISSAEHDAWEALQKLSVITPAVLPRDVVFVGIRDLEAPERKLIKDQGSLNLYADRLKDLSAQESIEMTTEHLKDCDYLYVSFDLDCLDASIVPGTGTPVGDGPNTKKVLEMLQHFTSLEKTICFELAEYNPELDKDFQTRDLAVEILNKIFL